jgi:hypothetical protein
MRIHLNNVRRYAKRHFRTKKREYLKDKMNDLATISKNKDIREGIEEQMNFRGVTNPKLT